MSELQHIAGDFYYLPGVVQIGVPVAGSDAIASKPYGGFPFIEWAGHSTLRTSPVGTRPTGPGGRPSQLARSAQDGRAHTQPMHLL